MAVKAIKYGMKGDPVANLQTTLNKYGYNLAVDGSFGPKTLAAVKDYQKKNGLTVDGMVGPQTQAALFSNTSSIAPTVSNPAAEDRPMAKDEENDPMPSVPPGVTNTVALPGNTNPAAGTGNANPTVVPGNTNPAVPENTKPAVTGGTNTVPATDGGSKNAAGSTAPAVNYPDPFTYDKFSHDDYVSSGAVANASGKPFSYGDFSHDDYVSSGAVAKASEKPFSYDDFSYGGYQESETVKQASAALDAVLAAQPGAYQSKWADQVNSIIDKILNRESFNYNFNEDPLYWQYAEQYTRKGKLAMQDTMGQAAALTGGYGNSYASTAGNQAYQEYLSQLNEVIPELRRMALDEYNMEGQELYNQYGLLSDQEAQDYGRYMDSYNQWLSERDYASGRYDSERNFDYGKYADDRNFAYGKYSDDRNLAYNDYLNAIELAKWQETDEYNKYLNDRNFEYGKYSEDRNMAYDQYLNAIELAKWQETDEYNKYLNDRNFAYGAYSDDRNLAYNEYLNKIGNAQWGAEFAADEEQRGIDNEYREKTYARDEAMAILEAGGTVSDDQLAAAGMSKEAAAALSNAYQKAAKSGIGSGSGNGGSDDGTSYVTDSDKIGKWSEAILDAETEEEALRYVERLEQLDPALADSLYEEWLKAHGLGHTITNTTVATPSTTGKGGGGGGMLPNFKQ